MNLNSLDTDKPKRTYTPYAAEPGAQGVDKPGCTEALMVVLLAAVGAATVLMMLALASPIGGGL